MPVGGRTWVPTDAQDRDGDGVERSPQGAFSTCSRLRHASPLPHILPREYTVAE